MTVSSRAIKLLSLLAISTACSVLAQVNTGELRVIVTDPAGAAHMCLSWSAVRERTIATPSSQIPQAPSTAKNFPSAFIPSRSTDPALRPPPSRADIHSAIPVQRSLHLGLAPITTVVKVSCAGYSHRSLHAVLCDADRFAANPGSRGIAAGSVGSGAGELATRMAVRGQCRTASARI